MSTITNLIAKTFLIASLSTSFHSVYASAKRDTPVIKKETSQEVKIQGQIFVNNKEVKGNFKVEVIFFDSITSSFTVKNNESVKLSLKKDSPYVLKISKKGFIPRYICLNTSTNEINSKNRVYNFYFETDFIEVSEAMRLDDEALQMPIDMIAYNKKTGNFDHNKEYSLFVKQRIYSGLTETQQLTKD